jgi:hypothetical protein
MPLDEAARALLLHEKVSYLHFGLRVSRLEAEGKSAESKGCETEQ